jgi:error-prone DNA polymerase
MLCKGDTIGIFQVESAAQMQTITRLWPRNLLDMAHEVGAVRPGVGVNHGVQEYLARRSKRKPVTYDCPLEQRPLERTLGVVLFQDQVNQLAIDVAGFAPSEADHLRRAFGRRHNEELIEQYRQKFLAGAAARGVPEAKAETVFKKFNGQYMFPESHAFAFGVTAYQAAWLKYYYPLEFFVAIFNQQPMGFYNLETLKEDARRHGIGVLNPDINKSRARCTIEDDFSPGEARRGVSPFEKNHPPLSKTGEEGKGRVREGFTHALRLGFRNVTGLGEASAKAIEAGREKFGAFKTIGDFLERTGVLEEVALNLAGAGAFDSLEPNRRRVKWEIGLRYRPVNSQLPLPLPVEQDIVALAAPSDWDRMKEEYSILSLFPAGHVMASLRRRFNGGFRTSRDIEKLPDGAPVTAAGLVIRRQRPHGKVVFVTLEDEFGHIPCMVFGQTYERYEHTFRSAFLIIKGNLTRREGTCNVVINHVEALNVLEKAPASKNWR